MYKNQEHNSFKILNRNNVIISFIIFSITFCKEIIFIQLYNNLNLATPFPKTINPRYYIVPPSDPKCPFDMLFIFNKHNYMQREQLDHWGEQSFKKLFLITMNYAQKYDLFFPFFIKVVVNKSKAYSFLIIGIMHLQKILLSVIMLRFHFFSAKQGTRVHKDDRGPFQTTSTRTRLQDPITSRGNC